MINISLSPNLTSSDTIIALKTLLTFGLFLSKKIQPELKRLFRENVFGTHDKIDFSRFFLVSSGRGALYLILKSLAFNKDDEIIIQAFTCMVVVNAIRWNGLKPVYADIDPKNHNLTLDSIKAKITEKTKAVIVQHTFGVPTPEIVLIKKFCEKNSLILIEDSAHAMGAMTETGPVGTIGDFSFFSFGRSKIISCVSGGIILLNNRIYHKQIETAFNSIKGPSHFESFQNLMHLVITPVAKIFYNTFKLGKILLYISQKIRLINLEVSKSEKLGIKPIHPVRELSLSMALIATNQLKKLISFNEKRRAFARQYHESLKDLNNIKMLDPSLNPGAVFLRFPVSVPSPEQILSEAAKRNIILGDWYKSPIAPPDIDFGKTAYKSGECKTAEQCCKHIINLPTHHSLTASQANQIIQLIKSCI